MSALPVGLAWLAGIFLGSLLAGSTDPLPALIFGAVSALGMAIIWWPQYRLRLALLCLAALLAGTARYQIGLPGYPPDAASHLAGQAVAIRGTVDAEVVDRDTWQEVVLSVQEARPRGGDWQPASGRVQVRAARWSAVAYGDRLEAEGKLELPKEGAEPGGFSYRRYLLGQGVLAIMYRPKLTVAPGAAPPGPWDGVMAGIYRLKVRLSTALSASLPEPEASLARGVLLGERAGMAKPVADAFRTTGTTHIIAISGFNIALIAGALLLLFQRLLGRRRATLPAIAGVILYTVLVGAAPSVVRAAIMGSILILGSHLGRRSDTLVSLVVAAVLMTMHEPIVLWDVGFQLSFLATAGLATMMPQLQQWMSGWPRWLSDALATTLAAQFAVLPVLLANFGQVSPVSLLANLVVLPAFPPLMVLGGATALLGTLWAPLGVAAGWLAWVPLAWTIRWVEAFAVLPLASLPAGPMPFWAIWGYYGILALRFVRPALAGTLPPVQPPTPGPGLPGWLPRGYPAWGLAIVGGALLGGTSLGAPPPEVQVAFLDVGQGDAALVHTPQSRIILVDGGPSPRALTNALGRRLPFWQRRIDLLVLTHPHEDHLAGLAEVLERYEVGQVLDTVTSSPSPAHRAFREAAARRGVPCVPAAAGQRIDLGGGAALEVLHPSPTCTGIHNCSALIRVTDGQTSVLITGDLDIQAQRRLASSPEASRILAAQVLKVPHHGAANGLDPAFLGAVAPEVAVISVGENTFGHPAEPTLQLLGGALLYRTDLNGTIEVDLATAGHRVHGER